MGGKGGGGGDCICLKHLLTDKSMGNTENDLLYFLFRAITLTLLDQSAQRRHPCSSPHSRAQPPEKGLISTYNTTYKERASPKQNL